VSKESAFWALLLLAALLCMMVGLFATRDKLRAATATALLVVALAVEAVNSYLSVKVSTANAALHHAGYANVLHRTAPTLPFHVTFVVLLVLAALVMPAPFDKSKAAEALKA